MAGPVLLAEHDPAVREMLRRYLVRDGHVVTTASTTEQTLAALGAGAAAAGQVPAAAVAVLDLTMPGLDPRRLRQALAALAPAAPPAVFLAAPGPRPRALAGSRHQGGGERRW